MDERRLRYFLAVVDEGSVTRAAERLRVAQPSLSQALRAFEESSASSCSTASAAACAYPPRERR